MTLAVKSITKSYRTQTVLNNISAEFTNGVYALIGPNGAGKSTFMRILAGVGKADSGAVYYNGQDIQVMGENYRDRLGYLPQEFSTYPHFTAERFLAYLGKLKGLNKEELPKKINELLVLTGLENERKKKVRKFSGGMKRRLGIAQALLNNPDVLIADEPTAGLDSKERMRFRKMLAEIAAERVVILSTHITSDIESVARRVLLLKNGSIEQNCTIPEMLETLCGEVWTITVSASEANKFEIDHQVTNIRYVEKGAELRIISAVPPHPNATAVEPTLEDVVFQAFDGGFEQ
ncbi:ABC transporter ATP-binding protein [Alteribacter natronophilus]|uniref:ABC transporter ATP-binding protein n=1 Tax=Alteribacter natronophilus TaxID=2583810 RepID=UPI00110E0B20|nr:ABC transporter ATP-binding protein [Alteribacter natronophilus]TMW70362.1 ABC transporter ATP-binding protein [Alteribacter natronophilus]